LNTKSDHSSNIEVDLVEQDISKLSYFDPSDAHDTNVRRNHANPVFHLDTVVMKNANDINQLIRILFIAKPIYFANEKSIEGYHCAQVSFEMTSKMLYVDGMKTESEFADINLDFIRKYGIPSALRRENAKSEMSQRVQDIHRDLIIADQWTEPHSPWKNPAELNGVKYLKSHAQVLLDRTGAPDNL
jgi:hypothetical protein